MKVGVVGASGYLGVELLRLCGQHPDLEVAVATAGHHGGIDVAQHTPSLAAAYPDLTYSPTDPSELDGLDAVFVALPHGQSQSLVPELTSKVGVIVDLAADFRLRDPSLYPNWYGQAHAAPELLGRFVYGLPELHREELAGARLIAAPGCYPTAAILALAPLIRAGVMAAPGGGDSGPGSSLIVDAASGASGAGRAPKESLHFGAVDEDFVAYGLLDHRHTPEMEQALGGPVLFTPHLAPMVRGILATCYGRPVLAGRRARWNVHRRSHGDPARGLRPRAVHRGHRGLPVDQGDHRVELRPPHRPGRRPHRVGGGHRRPRQSDQGWGGPGGAVRQPGARTGRGVGTTDGRGLPMSITTPEGFVAAGLASGIKASGALDLALVATEGGVAVPTAATFTTNLAAAAPVQVSRAHLLASGGLAAAVVVNSGNANAATGDSRSGRRHHHVRAGRGRARRPRPARPGLLHRPDRHRPTHGARSAEGIPALVASRSASAGSARMRPPGS